MIDALAGNAGSRDYDVTQNNTAFLIGVERFYPQNGQVVRRDNLSARNTVIENELLPNQYDYVAMGGSFIGHFNNGLFSIGNTAPELPDRQVFREAMDRMITEITGYGSTPVLIRGDPTFNFNVSDCTLNNLRFGLDNRCHLARDDFQEKFKEWGQFVDQLTEQFDELVVLDPAKVMCFEAWCYSELNGVPLYKDGGHLNYEGSKLTGRLYIDQFGNPFTFVAKRTY